MNKPVFCPQCRSRDTFERQPEKDVQEVESGKSLWEAWICKLCGYKAIIPVKEKVIA